MTNCAMKLSTIILDEGLCLCGRCVQGYRVGFITWISRDSYRIAWLHGREEEYPREDEE